MAQNIEWDFIKETLKPEKCILFLVPEILVVEKNKPLHSVFF
jgi:hypothetical protein